MRWDQEQAYIEYVTARGDTLRRIAYHLCGDTHRADDLVQEAITKLYLAWPKLDKVQHLDSYVRTILVRVFLNETRLKWAKVRFFASMPDAPERERDPADRLVLREALETLPKGQRTVLVLRFLCDLSIEDVAATLNCSAGSVKSQTSAGLVKLRQALARTNAADFPALRIAEQKG